jgi:hypothetical protein
MCYNQFCHENSIWVSLLLQKFSVFVTISKIHIFFIPQMIYNSLVLCKQRHYIHITCIYIYICPKCHVFRSNRFFSKITMWPCQYLRLQFTALKCGVRDICWIVKDMEGKYDGIIKILLMNLWGKSEENCEGPKTACVRQKFEPRTCQIQS